MKRIVTFILLLITLTASADIIAKPRVERLVNDFAGLLSENQAALLEDSLVRYARRTSTQVAVVTVNDLDGHDAAEYAYKIGETWGIGKDGKNNGVVILVKPKVGNSNGRAFIAPGYGLEGVLPDITCTHIVNDVMIPYFKQNNYESGIIAGAITVMRACEGEYEGDPEEDDIVGWLFAMIPLFVIIILIIIAIKDSDGRRNGGSHMSSGGSFSDAVILGNLLRNAGRSSDWGSFSGGGGSFGGGFGGFGGGHFGGGGGGGSW